MIKRRDYRKAITFLENRIAEYKRSTKKSPDGSAMHGEWLHSDMYFLLAKAKNAAGAPTVDVIAAYKQAVPRLAYRPHSVPAFLWLFGNMPADEYIDVVEKYVRTNTSMLDHIHRVAEDFESGKNWAAFELFLNVVFAQADRPVSYAEATAKGLDTGGAWANKFLEYCLGKPKVKEYVLAEREKHAEEYMQREDFSKALKIYRDLVSQCERDQDKYAYELKVHKCLFKSGKYDTALSELNAFINNNKPLNKDSVAEALLLKGQVYIQLSKIDSACETLTKLVTVYPETEQMPEATFFIGYCNMLQGKYGEATEVLNTVVKKYPESPHASKARLCLAGIKRMTE